MTDNDVDELTNRYPILITDDNAGITSLKILLIDLNYIDYENGKQDLIDWKIEALDPDWKTEYLDELRDTFGNPNHYFEWYCEKDSFESEEEKDSWCEKRIADLKLSGTQYKDKQIVEEFCKMTGRGSVIPLFLAEFQDDVAWIESHLVQKEVKSKRGTNPNSLKNLKQNKKGGDVKNAEET